MRWQAASHGLVWDTRAADFIGELGHRIHAERSFAAFPGIHDIGIDTVERFQGQEREFIIMSFTESDRECISRLADFLTLPQRLNVAVTRARSKVVLVHSASFMSMVKSDAPHDGNAALALSLLEEATLIRSWQG